MAQAPVHASLVQSIDIFRDLSLEQSREIAEKMTFLNCDAGQMIVTRKDQNRAVFFVVSGTVRVTSFANNGRESSYNDKAAGDVFGELAAIDGSPRVADVVAVSSTTLLSMSARDFTALLEDNFVVNVKVMQLLVREVRAMTQRVYEFAALGVASRIHKRVFELIQEAAGGKNSVTLTDFPKHLDIASRVTTTREAVTRELSRLSNLGLLKKTTEGIFVPDVSKFKEILHDHQGELSVLDTDAD